MLFLVRPGASPLKSRIIASLSAAVGRSVDIGSVHIRLLPRPGFDLENLVVYDDPAFSSEPMLRASEVTADLRLSSLLRGRLEVAKLDLTEPSLNLVHSGGGWNLDSLLERSARTPTAPTGKSKSEPRPGFPYIEGSSGRINFKNGPEKKPYALTNADFALWQESENTWGVRLKAQPLRSDMNLNDTGVLQVTGTWQRAGVFRDIPVQFNVEWARAQLGQITKFFTGNDRGWRGDLRFDATVTGTPAALKISSTVYLDDFRRYDITTGTSLRLAGRCDGEYVTHKHEFRNIDCSAPVEAGLITITGDSGLPGSHRYALVLTAESVPAGALGALARRVKRDLPEDLALEGRLHGRISISDNAASGSGPRAEGHAEITGLRVSSPSEKVELGPVTIPIVLTGASSGPRGRSKPLLSLGPRLDIGPFPLERGHPGAASIQGWADRSGYGFDVRGDAEVGRTLRVARMFGLRTPNPAAEGQAQLNLQVTGSWMWQSGNAEFAGPLVTGSAKLRNVHFALRGGGEPAEISSAELQLSPDQVNVDKLNAKAAGAVWRGSLQMPRGCGTPENCPIRFLLNTTEFSLADASAWATQSSKNRPWYRVLRTATPVPSLLSRVRASGRIVADHFILRGVSASRMSASVSLDSGKLVILSVDADFLGGKHRGKWLADFSAKPAVCGGSGDLAGISLASISKLMKDAWVDGTADATYEIHGPCAAEFWQSSEGTLQVNVGDGSLPHVFLEDSDEPLKIRRLTAQVRLRSGNVEISNGELDSPQGKYEVSGTATLKREIDIRLARVPTGSGSAYAIRGTLTQPRVAPVTGTEQARLKP